MQHARSFRRRSPQAISNGSVRPRSILAPSQRSSPQAISMSVHAACPLAPCHHEAISTASFPSTLLCLSPQRSFRQANSNAFQSMRAACPLSSQRNYSQATAFSIPPSGARPKLFPWSACSLPSGEALSKLFHNFLSVQAAFVPSQWSPPQTFHAFQFVRGARPLGFLSVHAACWLPLSAVHPRCMLAVPEAISNVSFLRTLSSPKASNPAFQRSSPKLLPKASFSSTLLSRALQRSPPQAISNGFQPVHVAFLAPSQRSSPQAISHAFLSFGIRPRHARPLGFLSVHPACSLPPSEAVHG
jgi:hypothetical protein